jgi:nucleotide-binding universal stress UspA family protein
VTKTIIVPWDGLPTTALAARIAAELGRRWDAELFLVTVASLPDPAHQDLDRLVETLHFEPTRTQVIESNDVGEAITGVVHKTPEPVVCMTTHGRGRIGTAMLGSVAEALLREAPCPFVLIGPHCAPDWPAAGHRLLACLDESTTSDAIITPAAEWAKALGFELWLAEVFHPLDVESARAPYRFLDTIVERLHPELPNVRACVAWNRSVQGEILHLARILSVSMIAMATHGHTGLARLALGSVTMTVAHAAACPVLTTRPPALH